jgi:hypothetical protein
VLLPGFDSGSEAGIREDLRCLRRRTTWYKSKPVHEVTGYIVVWSGGRVSDSGIYDYMYPVKSRVIAFIGLVFSFETVTYRITLNMRPLHDVLNTGSFRYFTKQGCHNHKNLSY